MVSSMGEKESYKCYLPLLLGHVFLKLFIKTGLSSEAACFLPQLLAQCLIIICRFIQWPRLTSGCCGDQPEQSTGSLGYQWHQSTLAVRSLGGGAWVYECCLPEAFASARCPPHTNGTVGRGAWWWLGHLATVTWESRWGWWTPHSKAENFKMTTAERWTQQVSLWGQGLRGCTARWWCGDPARPPGGRLCGSCVDPGRSGGQEE